MKSAAEALAKLEAAQRTFSVARVKGWLLVAIIVAFYLVAAELAQLDLGKLATGLPRLWDWLSRAWPPKFEELPVFLWRTAETVAMAAIGTTLATLIGLPFAILASRNITPFPLLYFPTRWFLNALRGIDSFVFALLFVAAVGLGPFAGVLGITLHTAGTAAKFFADQIESADPGPHTSIPAGYSAASTLNLAVLAGVQRPRLHCVGRRRRRRHRPGAEEQHGPSRLPPAFHNHSRHPHCRDSAGLAVGVAAQEACLTNG